MDRVRPLGDTGCVGLDELGTLEDHTWGGTDVNDAELQLSLPSLSKVHGKFFGGVNSWLATMTPCTQLARSEFFAYGT